MNIVYVSPYCPWPRNFGGRYRVDMVWTALAEHGSASLFVLGDDLDEAQKEKVGASGGICYPSRPETPLGRVARIAKGAVTGESIPSARFLWPSRALEIRDEIGRRDPDVVVLGDTYVAALAPSLADLGAAVIIDTMNVESRLYERITRTSPALVERAGYALMARNAASIERRVFPHAAEVWAVSDDDAAFYRDEVGLAAVQVIPNAVDCGPPTRALADPPEVTLVGWYLYPPNEAAALRLIDASRELTDAGVRHRTVLVGRDPTERMKAAASAARDVTITGEVDDVRPYLDRATVFAAPVVSGSGTKYKILEAMAAGCPVVTTPLGAEGLDLTDGRHASVVDPSVFSGALTTALGDEPALCEMGEDGRIWVGEHFSIGATKRRIRERLDAVVANSSRSTG